MTIKRLGNYELNEREPIMYDQEKIKKMKNHELAMEAYYYSINNDMIGGISEKKCDKMLWTDYRDVRFR